MIEASDLPKHVKWLAKNRELEIVLKNREIGVQWSVETTLAKLGELDLSVNFAFIDWLLEKYLDNSLDINFTTREKSWISGVLKNFYLYQPQLDKKDRNINSYGSIEDIEKKISEFEASFLGVHTSGHEKKRLISEFAHEQSAVLWKSNEYTVVVPFTSQAAQWWGKGTRWCTASRNAHEFFDRYNSKGILIIVVLPGGFAGEGVRKFQFYKGIDSLIAADERDVLLKPNFIHENWFYFDEIVIWAAENGAKCFDFIPCEFWETERGHLVFKKISVQNLSTDQITVDMCWDAIEELGVNLRWVPKAFCTEKLCRLAVEKTGLALQWVPNNIRSAELCWKAVSQDAMAIQWVPKKLLTQDICRFAAIKKPSVAKWINLAKQDQDIQEIAISNNGLLIRNLPERMITEKLAKLAVEQNPCALQFIPQSRMSTYLCSLAVSIDSYALQWVPDSLKTEDICIRAVKKDGLTLAYVPMRLISLEMCTIAIMNNAFAIYSVPRNWQVNFTEYLQKHSSILQNNLPQQNPPIFKNDCLINKLVDQSEALKKRYITSHNLII